MKGEADSRSRFCKQARTQDSMTGVQMFKILDPSSTELGGLSEHFQLPSGYGVIFGAFWTKLKTPGTYW